MSQFRKLLVKSLEVGSIYVAYSAKNKHLSRNGDKGVFVKVVHTTPQNVKVQVLGTTIETAIAKLDTRDDAWMYDPSGAEVQVAARIADKTAWPGFSPRMEREGWDGKVFMFNADELHLIDDEEHPHFGVTLLRHEGDTIDPEEDAPYVNTFLMSNIYPVNPPEWRVPRAQRMGIGAIELPLPPKPVAEQHNAIINQLAPLFATIHSNHRDENVSFAKVSLTEDEKEWCFNQQCHHKIQASEDFKVEYVLTMGFPKEGKGGLWAKDKAEGEALRFWITYLTSYSPYADVFLTKDVDFILEKGYILDASKPSRLVVGACFATRQVWEKGARARAFLELYKAGIPLHLAHVFGSQCSEFAGGKMKFAQSGNNHSHLHNERLSDKCIINFVDCKPQYAGKPYNERPDATSNVHGGTDGVDGMWSASFRTKPSPVYAKLREIKGAGSWGASLSVDEAVERAADIIDDWAAKVGI